MPWDVSCLYSVISLRSAVERDPIVVEYSVYGDNNCEEEPTSTYSTFAHPGPDLRLNWGVVGFGRRSDSEHVHHTLDTQLRLPNKWPAHSKTERHKIPWNRRQSFQDTGRV